jgi:hypothetical protein
MWRVISQKNHRELEMKKLLIALAMVGGASHAQNLPPYGSYIMQADPTGVFFYGRYFTPTVITDSYFLVYDGNISQPKIGAMGSSFSWNGTTLDIGSINQSQVSGLTSALAGKYNTPSGTTSQYVRGDGSLSTLPTTPARSFATPTRALNTCFQISSSRDAFATYAVDVTTTVTLGGSPEGAVFLRTYTNSGCSTGQVGITSGTSGQPTTLTVSVGQQVKGSVNLSGMIPAGAWARIETSNVSGTPTFSIRSEQQEVQL